jgi:hypothetical protein
LLANLLAHRLLDADKSIELTPAVATLTMRSTGNISTQQSNAK